MQDKYLICTMQEPGRESQSITFRIRHRVVPIEKIGDKPSNRLMNILYNLWMSISLFKYICPLFKNPLYENLFPHYEGSL
jgi:hypothetical protein